MGSIRNCPPRKNLLGQRFGKLIAIEYVNFGKWKCICDCGNTTVTSTHYLITGHTKSCGCLIQSSKNVIDMTGYEDANLKVIERADNISNTAAWKCICKQCGRTFITKGSNIRRGDTQSCGCVRSYAEQYLTQQLESNCIPYEPQYSFPDLIGVGGRRLRFDFAIFSADGGLARLVELQGEQHYERSSGAWGSNYDNQIENDRRKKEYCEKNDIPLIIIDCKVPWSIWDVLE